MEDHVIGNAIVVGVVVVAAAASIAVDAWHIWNNQKTIHYRPVRHQLRPVRMQYRPVMLQLRPVRMQYRPVRLQLRPPLRNLKQMLSEVNKNSTMKDVEW